MEIVLDRDCVFVTDKTSGARVVIRAVDGVFAVHPVLNEHVGGPHAGTLSVSKPPKAIVPFTKMQMAFLFLAEEHLMRPDHNTWVRPDWQNLRLENLTFNHTTERAQFFKALKETFGVDFDYQYLDQLQTIGAVYNYVMTLNPNLRVNDQ